MEALIRNLTAGKAPAEVDALELHAWRGTALSERDKAEIERFPELTFVSFKGCGLTSLKNFPTNKHLQEVELSDNQLTGGLEPLAALRELMSVTLDNNHIRSYDALEPLKRLAQLKIIDLQGNPLAQESNYPGKLFNMLDSLKAVDGHGPTGEPIDELPIDEESPDEDESPNEEDDDYSASEDDDDEDEDDEDDFASDEDDYVARKRPRTARGKAAPHKKSKH